MYSKQSSKVNQLELFSKNNLFVYLTSLYIIVWYLQLGTRISILGTIRFEFLLGAFLGLSALFQQLQSRAITSELTKYVYLFFLMLIIQIPFSANVSYSFDIFIDRVVKFSLLAVFISTFIKSPSALKIFIFGFLLACFRLGMEGFIGWRSGGLVWQNQGIMRLHGSIPILEHPNSFSGFGVCLLPFIYYLFPQVSKLYKSLLLLLLVFALVIIIFTGSRAGYVATFGFIGFAVYKSKYRLKVATSFIIILIISFPFIPEQYIERFESIYSSKEKEGNSKEARINILKDSLHIFLDNPFGVGVAAFPTVREQYFGKKQDTHNLYFEVLTNLGIQGFIVFLILIWKLFKTISNNEKELKIIKSRAPPKNTNEGRPFYVTDNIVSQINFCLAISHAVKAYVIVRLFLGLFGMDLYEIYWWIAIGLTLSIRTISQTITALTNSHIKDTYQHN